MKDYIIGANPYMPLWEHVPDGEPRVFEHGGETRVYVYGSHDTCRNKYCGSDYVVWSAPADDLTDWRCDGTAFSADNILYAPDVVKKNDKYYMYIAMHEGSTIYVAESDSPAGPFVNPRKTDFGFDIGVLVDDDGRCYAYWGFKKCFAAEINPDMATIKQGTLRCNMIPHCGFRDNLWDTENIDNEFSYFEAASIRKVMGKYVFIYSKRDMLGNPERGRRPSTNDCLDYAYSDSPLDGWVHGGTIVANSGQTIVNADGTRKRSYHKCNNHGSIAEINGRLYIFYHRGTGTNEFARQAMLEPIDAALTESGALLIGQITYDDAGRPISCDEAEMTSQGAHIEGLDGFKIISAGYACYIDSGEGDSRAYVLPVYDRNNPSSPVVNISNGDVVGFKYIRLTGAKRMSVRAAAPCGAKITVTADRPGGREVCRLNVPAGDYCVATAELSGAVSGSRALFFTFNTKAPCSFDCFTFDK